MMGFVFEYTSLRRLALASCAILPVFAASSPALADKFRNPTAVFSGLDKITGRIINFEVNIDETVQFGALQLTPRVCYSRPITERPQTTAFIEVEEISTNNELKRLFSGWIFASSPGLSAIEHPVYDIWLTACKGAQEKDRIKTRPEEEEYVPPPSNENQLARPLGQDGRPQLDPEERALLERRRQQQIQRSTTSGPILPGQPLNTGPSGPIRPEPSQRFFPLPTDRRGIGGANPGIFVNPQGNN